MTTLLEHKWPGNIRELENVMEHAVVIESTNKICVSSLPSYLSGYDPMGQGIDLEEDEDLEAEPISTAGGELDYRSFKERAEKEFIIKALKTFNGRINQTAMHANIPKKTLLRKLQKYQIRAEDYRV